MNEPRQHTRSDFWPALGLMAASIGLSIMFCYPVLNAPLVSDDWVLLDALVRNGIWGAWGGGGHEMLGFFRPLMTLTLWVNMQLGGLNPLGYHLFNVIVHGIAAWLVLLISLQLVPKELARKNSSVLIGIVAWFFFLVHPSHAEPVAWISSRPDLMACALALGSLSAWIAASNAGAFRRTLSGVLFVLALFAKESAIVLPLIILTYEFVMRMKGDFRSRAMGAVRRTWPFFVILVCFMILRAAALGHTVGGYGSGRILAISPLFWARNLVVATIRSLLPAIPSPGFDGTARIVYAAIGIAGAASIAVALVWSGAKNRPHRPNGSYRRPIVFCLLAFFISILPVINLPASLRSSEGERFIYLGSAFMVIALTMAIGKNYNINANITTCFIMVVYIIGFESSLRVWEKAGTLAGDLVGDLKQISAQGTTQEIVVLDLPDNLRGAYVFRNGFVEAARLNGITRDLVKTIRVKSTKQIDTIADEHLKIEGNR